MKNKYVQMKLEAFLLGYAKEAAGCRNPAAVFVSLLKKELDYRPKAAKAGQL